MFKKTFLVIGITLFALIILTNFLAGKSTRNIIQVAGKQISVEIADTSEKQILGLSNRKTMAENQGMLFVFESPITPGFWMKDMNFGLDIIWIDNDGKIVGIEKNISPDTYPKTFFPPSPIKYVLEVNARWSDKNNLKTGDQVTFPY